MTGKLDKFYVDHDIHGARVMARSHTLTAGCIADGEIDGMVEMLKADLDACGREMKRLVKRDRRALFERGRAGDSLSVTVPRLSATARRTDSA